VPKLPLVYCGSSPLVQSLSLAIRALTAIVLKRKPENKEKFFPNTKNQNDLELTKRNYEEFFLTKRLNQWYSRNRRLVH